MADKVTTSLAEAKILVMEGQKGEDGATGPEGPQGVPGTDGVSPAVSFEPITVDGRTGNKMTVTDAEHPGGQSINILNGKDGESGGTVITVDSELSGESKNPVQNKVINAALQSKGTYSKPSGGIPASDLASGVIPVVPQMATAANMSDWTSGKTVDAATLKADFSSAIQRLEGVEISIDNLQTEVSQKADSADIPAKTSDLTNDSGFQTAQQVQTAIAPLQPKAITDTGNYYTTDTVEGALQEIGAELAGVNTLIGTGVIS